MTKQNTQSTSQVQSGAELKTKVPEVSIITYKAHSSKDSQSYAHHLRSLSRQPNFVSTYHGLFPIEQSVLIDS